MRRTFPDTIVDGPSQPFRAPKPWARIALRLFGLAVFGYYLIYTGAVWPVTTQAVLIVAGLVCWLGWMLVADSLPVPVFIALAGAPALVGSVIGASPDQYGLAIVFSLGGIIGVVASARVDMRVGLALAAGCLVLFEIASSFGPEDFANRMWTSFGICMAAVMGYSRRQSRRAAEQTRRLIESQQQLLAQAETVRAEQTRSAALAERSRIARDLHDVLAHALGGLVVQLDAAEAVLTVKGDVDDASARLRKARGLAVEGLDDARKAVTALRTETPVLVDALQSLVDDYDGGPAVLKRGAAVAEAPDDVTLALIAVVREALNNSRKHASGARVTVWLRAGDGEVGVDVTSATGTPSELAETGTGTGIAGMRERMDAVHGSLRAGPAAGSTWRVSASAPAGEPE